MTNTQYFGTDGIRGDVGKEPITPEFMLKLGWAAGSVLHSKHGKASVLIGKDTRISGYMFESALEAGFSAAGVDVKLLGPMPTPAIAYLTHTFRADFGIVISASHNLFMDNGVKFFSRDGFKISENLEREIEKKLACTMKCVPSQLLGKAARVSDAPGRYIEFCKSTFPSYLNLDGMKIVIDCAHGATYHIAPNVIRELGAEVIEINSDPDGLNINDNCGSTSPASLQRLVVAEKADIGLAFDGDGDRLIIIDKDGEIVDGDECLYIITKYNLDRGVTLGGVVGTLMSNLGLEKAIIDLGLSFKRTQVGDRHVMELLRQNKWLIGGEQSGHIICLNKTTTGDGIVSALQVLAAIVKSKKPLSELRKKFIKYPQRLTNIPLKKNTEILENHHVKDAIATANQRLKGNGRLLIRKSGTEPLLRLMIESDTLSLVDELTDSLTEVLTKACTD